MNTSTFSGTRPQEIIGQLQRDLSVAIDKAPDGVLRNWGKEVASRFVRAGTKRVTGLATLASKLTVAVADEIFDLLRAFTRGNLADHMQNRLDAGSRAANALGAALKRTASAIAELAQRSPAEAATALLSFVVGFYAGSGGDGDGGLPDLDLMAGIGAHRSIFTHSILIGTVVETAVLSLVDLTKAIHAQLPDDRHPLWDQLLAAQITASENFVTGASIGISAHLGIDSSVDGFTPYKDLPISLPMEAHRALLELNAAAEGIRRHSAR